MVLRGEDFSDPKGNSTHYVDVIKGSLFRHVARCGGHAVVLFDEVGGEIRSPRNPNMQSLALGAIHHLLRGAGA
jgi:hypothetical protein